MYLRKTTATEDRYSTSCKKEAEFLDQMEKGFKKKKLFSKDKKITGVTGINGYKKELIQKYWA